MPEIVEVEIVAEQLYEEVLEDRIVKVEFPSVENTPIIRPLTNTEFAEKITGCKIYDVYRIGKEIVFDLGEFYMVSALRMTGRWLLDVPEEKIGHTRVILHLESGRVLRYSDVRKFGTLRIMSLYDVNGLIKGLDVWYEPSEEIMNVLYHTPVAKGKTIKQLILAQDLLNGLGNIYVCEVLRKAKFHPNTPAEMIVNDFDKVELLAETIREKIQEGYKRGGLSVKDYYHLDGTKGEMQNHLVVYRQEFCTCGTKVERATFADKRTSYYCPSCQKE